MINPGGSPGTSFSKSATTRFNNSQINAARATMPFNKAAQQALRSQSSSAKPGGPPVGQVLNTIAPPVAEVDLPTGGPQLPEPVESFDPAVFQEEKINEVVGTIRTQQFLNSPRVKDAATSVRLKNYFNSTNQSRVPDPRNLLEQVISRLRLGPR